MSTGSIADEQLARLRNVLSAVTPTNRFYSPRLRAAGVDATIRNLDDFRARMPFTTKAELVADQDANPPYGSNLTYPVECYTRFCQTSGTSGKPLVILDDNESWAWLLGNWAHIYRAAGLVPGDRIYFAFSFGPFLGFWTAFEAAAKLGFLCIPGGGLGTAARVRALIEHRATVLCCTPTYALHLADVARSEGVDLAGAAIRTIVVAGEPGGSVPEVRDRIIHRWNGAKVVDHYGMTEVGPVAYEDPANGEGLRVIGSSYFAEVVDPDSGDAVASGAVGELVLTTLGRTGCPLFRYRTGDLVSARFDDDGVMLCGGIIARADDMVVVRGVNIYPASLDAVVRKVPGILEYRVEVDRRKSLIELTIVAESATLDAATNLENALAHAFALRIPIRRVPEGTLPRFEFKAKRWQTLH